jgi:propanol-preferring alcohol dehydrogenase
MQSGKTELVEIPTPKPGDDEVLVRVKAAGVCHSDLQSFTRRPQAGYRLPMTMGHEVAGTIESLGSGVKDFKVDNFQIPLFRRR